MFDPIEQLVRQYLLHVEAAYKEKKYRQAYKILMKIMDYVPDHPDILKMKAKIEEAVQHFNIHVIDEKIEEIQPLLQQGKYVEALPQLEALYEKSPQYTPLVTLLAKVQSKYRAEIQAQKSKTLKYYEDELRLLLKSGSFEQLFDKMIATEKFHPGDPAYHAIHIQIKDDFVAMKLKEQKELLSSEKYDDIINFLLQLRNIHPHSFEIERLLKKFRQKRLGIDIVGREDRIFRMQEDLKNLYLLKKYEKAIELAEDLMIFDPSNSFAKRIYKKATKKLNAILNEESIAFMEEKISQQKKSSTSADDFVEL